jgi:precorrin-2/cobalt-factor-2 C20-methyltransferase
VLKTSVYLSADLKADLAEAAARSGRSEADFIRAAIAGAVQQARAGVAPDAPARAKPAGPGLVGVGVGPGSADLLTTRAIDAIRRADTIFAASVSADAIGRAEAVARAALGPVRVTRVVVDVAGSAKARAASLRAAAGRLVEHLDRRELVAFLTIGDPNLFSIFPALADAVRAERPAVAVEVVPGLTAFQELAARSGTVVAADGGSVRIVAVGQDAEAPAALVRDSLARPGETLVLYRGGRSVPAIARDLLEAGRSSAAVVGELLGLPGERCAPVEEYLEGPASYLASLIAPPAKAR